MGKILKQAGIVIILLCCCLSVYSQGTTSKGTEFWTAYMVNSNPPGSNPGSVMVLYITSDINTTGTATLNDGTFSQNFTVNANQITVITIPPGAYITSPGKSNKGIHITSLKPVAIYAHIFAENSSGATLLLPVNTLGKDYYSINYTQRANQTAYSTFMVIATEDNTTIQVTPSSTLLDGSLANKSFTVSLNKGQVYQAESADDLTGSRIQSISSGSNACTKIAVFSGSSRIYIGCNPQNSSSDNLFQQVYPTASWGKNYVTVPLKNRNYDIFRIVLSDPNTNVQLNGTTIAQSAFTNNLYYEFSASVPNNVTADKPIQVVQYAVSQANNTTCGVDDKDVGDPEMIYLTPLEQTIDHVTLFSASNFDILNSYINVVIKAADVPSFILDGNHYGSFTPVPNNSAYSYAQIGVSSGRAHSISAGNGFNAIAYGFGQHESYGYAAGANLQDLNSFIGLQPQASNILQSNGCTDVSYNLILTLPYPPSSITWDPQDGTAPFTIANPVPKIVQKNDQTLYEYAYPKPAKRYVIGSYLVTATVFNPYTDVCGSTQVYELDYNISDPPTAKFTVSSTCAGDLIQFTDQSTMSAPITKWLWDFGDGQTSVLQNPKHAFANGGDYTVGMTITDADSCISVYPLAVHIYKNPVASFGVSTPNCIGQPITFTDQSTTPEGNIVQWIWDFGDGDIETLTTKTPTISHTYANTGIYTVKFSVVTDNGCTSPVFPQTVTISPLPQVDFIMPDVCLNDAFAQFTDATTIADGTDASFTYLWNFGDPNANAENPNISTKKNPKHSYSSAANYNVTLTVQSKYGCPVSKTQLFTVNGANPVADFTINNNNSCSSDDIIFTDNSHVNFGNITRLVWYFDHNNNPQDSTVYTRDNMPADKKYTHTYGVFNAGTSKNYDVKLVVYSGNSVQSCSNTTDNVVTQNVNPTATLSQIGNICQGANPVQIVVDKMGFTGNGVFTGPGVSSSGIFNPAIAGVGTVTVNYTFTSSQNSCTYTTSEQINVIADPTASADPVVNILEGDQATLNATASGNNVTYKWTPSIGLNHDDILNPVVSATNDTQYTLTVTSADNCTAQAGVFVKVLKKIIIPNTFTPNGDGINDTWAIKYLQDYPGCTVDVFNRYGQKVYSSVSYSVEWDGTYKGNSLPTGTYYYIINPKHGRTTVSGSVTIVR